MRPCSLYIENYYYFLQVGSYFPLEFRTPSRSLSHKHGREHERTVCEQPLLPVKALNQKL